MLVEHEHYPVVRACWLLDLPSSSYYDAPRRAEDPALVTAIKAMLSEFITYGTRRVSQQLRRAPQERRVNRKRAQRIMR